MKQIYEKKLISLFNATFYIEDIISMVLEKMVDPETDSGEFVPALMISLSGVSTPLVFLKEPILVLKFLQNSLKAIDHTSLILNHKMSGAPDDTLLVPTTRQEIIEEQFMELSDLIEKIKLKAASLASADAIREEAEKADAAKKSPEVEVVEEDILEGVNRIRVVNPDSPDDALSSTESKQIMDPDTP